MLGRIKVKIAVSRECSGPRILLFNDTTVDSTTDSFVTNPIDIQ